MEEDIQVEMRKERRTDEVSGTTASGWQRGY